MLNKNRKQIEKNDYEFDYSPESNKKKEKSGILSFWCDLEFSQPLIKKLDIENIAQKNDLNKDECEIYFDINVLESKANVRIVHSDSNKTLEKIELYKDEYEELIEYAEKYIQHEWADFNSIERPITLIEFYITKVLYDEHFEYDPNVECEDCFILAEGINKIRNFYEKNSTRNEIMDVHKIMDIDEIIDIHEIMDVYIDRLKKGTILDKQKFRELDDISLVRSFEMLMFQIEGEKYREEHQGRNNFQEITTEEDSEEVL